VSDYILRSDPGLTVAAKESAWDSFFTALEETTPEVMKALLQSPFEVFRELVEEYKKVSSYEFGQVLCERDGRRTFHAHPLSDLALLICSPEKERPKSDWPPSAAFWEPTMRSPILSLTAVMRQWAAHFLDKDRNPHFRFVTVALATMRTWLLQPDTIASDHWLGQAKAIARRAIQPQRIALTIKAWSPTEETEVEFKARIKAANQRLVRFSKDHIADVKSRLVKYDTKRNPEHFCWTALRLAREMTYPAIAELWANRTDHHLDLDVGTVRKGVLAALRDLDLRDVRSRRK
jgi:hypothetical protein